MVQIGYTLSTEEHDGPTLVRLAVEAEHAGFSFATISDHFHPWTERQGHAPFAWAVLGGIAASTHSLRVGTGVTCPLVRYHPAVIAQAAATIGEMMPGRFFLGVGTGEALNEHIGGARWPPATVRQEMLIEAIGVIRALWRGETVDHHGPHYTVEGAKVFADPSGTELYMAAGGTDSARIAGRIADGLVTTKPDPELRAAFDETFGAHGRNHLVQLTVCWADDEDAARCTAYEWWPNIAIEAQLAQELPMPSHFEQAAHMVTEDAVAAAMVLGPDPEAHVDAIRACIDAGYEQVVVHQVGPDQQGFLDGYANEVLPELISKNSEAMV